MLDGPLDTIDEARLRRLVQIGAAESRRLDFKLELWGRPDSEVREFLMDVASFANTDGGDLVIGIRDENGTAAELIGIVADNLDERIRGLQDQARACIDPKIPSLRFHQVGLDSGRIALIIRVDASLVAPHRVYHKGSTRFVARADRNRHDMDTSELRRAFAASDQLPRQIRDLHQNAIAATTGREMPAAFPAKPRIVATVAPLSVLREIRDIPFEEGRAVVPTPRGGGFNFILGVDNLIALLPIEGGAQITEGWAVHHRVGYIDTAWTIGAERGQRHYVYRNKVEQQLPGMINSSVLRLREYGVDGPWIAMATVLGIRHHVVPLDQIHATASAWMDTAYLGEIMDDELGREAILPMIERFWRAFGERELPPGRIA